jgi:hypothetical protein
MAVAQWRVWSATPGVFGAIRFANIISHPHGLVLARVGSAESWHWRANWVHAGCKSCGRAGDGPAPAHARPSTAAARGGRAALQKPLPSTMPVVPAPIPVPADVRLGLHPDDATPIPRPSRYYGRRQDPVTRGESVVLRCREVSVP